MLSQLKIGVCLEFHQATCCAFVHHTRGVVRLALWLSEFCEFCAGLGLVFPASL